MIDLDSQSFFKILGLNSDDKCIYFIDRQGLLKAWDAERLSQSKLMTLAPLSYWWQHAHGQTLKPLDWMTFTDSIIQYALSKPFNPNAVLGRGAFVNDDGNVVFNDGEIRYGEEKENQVFLKKNKIDIGIDSQTPDPEVLKVMLDVSKSLTFEKDIDCYRFLSWCMLSPFCGALSWRPSILITGESGSGKSTVFDNILKKISLPAAFSAGSSVPAIRRSVGYDSGAIVIEEAEGMTEEDKKLRNEYFKLMRVSSSNDAPDLVKCNKDGVDRYKMQNMFAFISIDPTIKNNADENRIFHINLKSGTDKPKQWTEKKKRIESTFSDDNCRAVRSFVWENLSSILERSQEFSYLIQEKTMYDNRTSYAESMLFAVFYTVFHEGQDIETVMNEYLKDFEIVKKTDNTQAFVDKILNSMIDIDKTEKASIYEIMYTLLSDGRTPGDCNDILNEKRLSFYKLALNRYGIDVDGRDTGTVYISASNELFQQLLRVEPGYGKILRRHKSFKAYKNKTILRKNDKRYWFGKEFFMDSEEKSDETTD